MRDVYFGEERQGIMPDIHETIIEHSNEEINSWKWLAAVEHETFKTCSCGYPFITSIQHKGDRCIECTNGYAAKNREWCLKYARDHAEEFKFINRERVRKSRLKKRMAHA